MLREDFRQLNKEQLFWRPSDRVLLAVSGGLDSMTLLGLFLSLEPAERPKFGVAHFNHQLREASATEADFVAEYCLKAEVPYFSEAWQDPQVGNLEQRAREARYAFFSEVCQTEDYDCLVTAHHSDDQAETILMKLSSGAQLQNLVGIRPISQRQGLVIYRPLLSFSKSELLDWAERHELPYVEDESNASDRYLRNRVRHQLVPKFKRENENFLKHIHNFVKQITYANDIIEDKVKELWPQVIRNQGEKWTIDLRAFGSLTESQQYMLLVSLWQEVLVVKEVPVNEQQLTQVLRVLRADVGAREIHLANGWRLIKSYQVAYLQQVESRSVWDSPQAITLGEGRYLSPGEWLGFEAVSQPLDRPQGINQWQEFECPIPPELVSQSLMVRKVQPGDRLLYNEGGHHKKVNRVFIDAKIPREKREKTWLVTDSVGEILWIVPIRKSYLSIVKETDKIHYRLIYLKSEGL